MSAFPSELDRQTTVAEASSEPGAEREEIVKSWDEFLARGHVREALKPHWRVIFRGQANARHGLAPSLIRAVQQTLLQPTPAEVYKYEKACRREFETQAHLYMNASLLSALPTSVHWWMHMQHFGAPTRLLDWTGSPFVAAYFACESAPDDDGAVWSLDVQLAPFHMPRAFENRDEPTLARDLFCAEPARSLHILMTGHRNERMVAQRGVFTLSPDASSDHHHILSRIAASRTNESAFRKIRIPKSMKRDFYEKLLAMNINARSLFPGADGLGKSITELAKFAALPDLR
jgi:FRG domain